MNQTTLIIFIAVITIFCFAGSAFILAFVFRRKRERERKMNSGIIRRAGWTDPRLKVRPGPMILFWLVFYCVIGAIILWQAGRGIPNRYYADISAVLVPPVFLAIGAAMKYSFDKRRRLATAPASAEVVSIERKASSDGHVSYAPVYEFFAEGSVFKVTSPSSFSKSPLKAGDHVDLFFTPDLPSYIYVPGYENPPILFIVYLHIIGILFPLIVLAGPVLRPWLE